MAGSHERGRLAKSGGTVCLRPRGTQQIVATPVTVATDCDGGSIAAATAVTVSAPGSPENPLPVGVPTGPLVEADSAPHPSATPFLIWLPAAVLLGLGVVEVIRDGGFWRPDAIVVAIISLPLIAAALLPRRLDGRSLAFVGAAALVTGWWLLRAVETSSWRTFFPFGASMLGLVATFIAVKNLMGRSRDAAAFAAAMFGAALSLFGFVGLIIRWFPVAMPAQGLWRLSTSITYSDAAGAVLGVCLLIALSGSAPLEWLNRVAVCLCAAGLIATESRGAIIATICGCVLVPVAQHRRFTIALAAGALLGAFAVATSPSAHAVPALAVALAVLVAVAACWHPSLRLPAGLGGRRRLIIVAAAMLAVASALALLTHHEIGLRALAPSDQDRAYEWSAAWHQFLAAPYLGVGPDVLLRFQAPDGTYAHFAHNEYLQIAADTGIVGLMLLVGAFAAAARLVRRSDAVSSCAVGALVCWAVVGAFDFDWHIPVFGLLGGCAIGLAARRGHGETAHA